MVTGKNRSRQEVTVQKTEDNDQNEDTNKNEKKEEVRTRLASVKLKACQNREKAINSILSRMADRGQRQVNLFTTIAEKTEAFYVAKGKTFSAYDALVVNVTAKKAEAQTAVDATKAASMKFACDGTDPKGAAASFKQYLKTQNAALKNYKTAVKNLIVGVKSVQSTTISTENSTGGNE